MEITSVEGLKVYRLHNGCVNSKLLGIIQSWMDKEINPGDESLYVCQVFEVQTDISTFVTLSRKSSEKLGGILLNMGLAKFTVQYTNNIEDWAFTDFSDVKYFEPEDLQIDMLEVGPLFTSENLAPRDSEINPPNKELATEVVNEIEIEIIDYLDIIYVNPETLQRVDVEMLEVGALFDEAAATTSQNLVPCEINPPNKKIRRKWTTETMVKAVNEAVNGASFRGTALKYNLPYLALVKRVKADTRYTGPLIDKIGMPPLFTPEEENALVVNINEMVKAFHTDVTLSMLSGIGSEYADNLQKKPHSTKSKASLDWARKFLKRHKDFILKKSEVLNINRLPYRESLTEFYLEIKSAMLRHKFKPSRIYNVDEVSFTVIREIEKNSEVCDHRPTSSRQEINNISLCCCMNATGSFIPPMFVYPKRLAKSLMVVGGLNSIHTFSNDGWMTKDLFYLWLNIFVAYSKASVEDPVLLVLDNHVSHISLNTYTFGTNNGVIMVSMPSNISDKDQPLLLTVFDPLKKAFYDRYHSASQFTCQDIPALITNALIQVSTTKNAVDGFAKSGIYPLIT